MKESLEEVKRKYKLSEEEHEKIGEEIKRIMLFGKIPVKNPKAIFDIAPPGSGKTGLNGYGTKQFEGNNVVVINSDELKPFHPKIDEIAKLYPEYYTKVTDQESNSWTDDLFDTVLKEGYNVIYEGTGRNLRIIETMKTKMKDYEITVRGMAVNELNCLMSILERYASQVETRGWGRLVTKEHFYKAYNVMLDTIDTMEKLDFVDAVEIYTRGEEPTKPIKIYESSDTSKRFPNARFAVINGRVEDARRAIEYFPVYHNGMRELLKNKALTEEEENILKKVQELYDELNNKLSENSITSER